MALSKNSARALFKSLIDCFSDAVFYVNQWGCVEEINNAAQNIFHIESLTTCERSMAELLNTDAFSNLKDQGSFRWNCQSAEEETTYLVHCRAFGKDLKLPGLVVILRDISDSQKMA
ncbi:PAS domain-containing protein, partial [bacterium]|nr:PAS domain-containing protein [bacterium]